MAKIFEIEATQTSSCVFRIKAESAEQADKLFTRYMEEKEPEFMIRLNELQYGDIDFSEVYEPELSDDEDHWIDVCAEDFDDDEEE